MAQQQLFQPSDGTQPPEFRKARVPLLWPPSLKKRLRAICRERRVSLNDVLLRLVLTGLETGDFERALEEAKREQTPLQLGIGRRPWAEEEDEHEAA